MAVVDTVDILKLGKITDEEYFKAAVLGWCVELVRCSVYSFIGVSVDIGVICPASSLLSRLGRYYGRFHHAAISAVLVPRSGSGNDRYQ